jgi:alanyl-tRNA synthetase
VEKMGATPIESLAAKEPYVTEFEATVRAVDGCEVRLDQTYFYPESGGQPADCGTLNGFEVTDVQKRADTIVHTIASDNPLQEGETITGQIDEEFRTYCMRAHTAGHVLYGAGRRRFDEHGYGGFDIGTEQSRLDFETECDPNEVDVMSLEKELNEIVWDSRPVTWEAVDVDRARNRDDVVFNVTDNAGLADTVRVVTVDEWDVAACGGTHVNNTREIGPIAVLGVSNPGADLLRIEYAVGPLAVQARIDDRQRAKRAAACLDTSVEELPEQTNRLVAQNRSLEQELDRLYERLIETQLESIAADSVSKAGRDWVAGVINDADPKKLAEQLNGLDEDIGDVVAVAGADGGTFVAVATDGTVNASEVVDDVTTQFGGGGGGGPTFAQGGGIDADPESVVEYLRDSS